mgnify:CR=1 FL=1
MNSKRKRKSDRTEKYTHLLYGLICGFLNGLFGSGGGTVAVPAFEKNGTEPKKAHASSVALIFVLSLVTAVIYLINGKLDFGTALEYIPYGLIGAILGSFLLGKIPDRLKDNIRSAYDCKRSEDDIMNILVGILTGATASMGLGGGFILLVYLSVFTEIPQDIAQGINLLFFLPIALLSLVIHIKNKLTDLKLVGKYLILGLPCAVVGSYVAGITDVAVLRKLFGIFVLYIGINQLYVSFSNKPCKKGSDSK